MCLSGFSEYAGIRNVFEDKTGVEMRNLIVGFILGTAAATAFAATVGADVDVVNFTRIKWSKNVVLTAGQTIACQWPGVDFSQTVPANKTARFTIGLMGTLE